MDASLAYFQQQQNATSDLFKLIKVRITPVLCLLYNNIPKMPRKGKNKLRKVKVIAYTLSVQ